MAINTFSLLHIHLKTPCNENYSLIILLLSVPTYLQMLSTDVLIWYYKCPINLSVKN